MQVHYGEGAGSRVSLNRVARRSQHGRIDVVQERGEPLLLPLPCGLPYARQRLCHALPSLCPVRALLIRVPFGPRPWLHRLRHRSPGFVRRLRRCLYAPLPTLRRRPRGRLRTARGRCGSLLLHRSGLSPHTPCRSPGALTRVAARTLAPSPICDALYRRLQPFRHLHDCSGCFRLERSPGGTCTHWKAPPSHGARK